MRISRFFFASMSAAVVLVILAFSTVFAGNYHSAGSHKCLDCHLAHSDSSKDGTLPPSGEKAVSRRLIGGPDATRTCLTCHDGKRGTPDVVGEDVNNPNERMDGNERAAGWFPESAAGNAKGHDLPGSSDRSVASCTVCHDPHGNGNYRNLRVLDDSTSGPSAFVKPSATGLDRYRRSNIGYACNFSKQLCASCHGCAWSFCMESSDRGGRYQRHPNNEEETVVTITAPCNDCEHWKKGSGSGFEVEGQRVPRLPFAVHKARNYEEASQVSEKNEVFCLSCHKAHGSDHAFGMQWPYGSGKGLERSSGCNQCHNVSGQS